MKQIRDFADERLGDYCVHCGSRPATSDHAPSRVLLDEPYPTELPVVPACLKCNQELSTDEEYLACLIDCTLAGSSDASAVGRPKVQRLLREKPLLATRLAQSMRSGNNATLFTIEADRVQRVILKLARAHAFYELAEHCFDERSHLAYAPLCTTSKSGRDAFERLPGCSVWPEVGSRAMQRLLGIGGSGDGWIVVQEGRYRYATIANGSVIVRVVLSEYLAAEVVWTPD